MNPRERGFLLLTCKLGNPDRKVLTVPQLRTLAERMRTATGWDPEKELEIRDLMELGYSRDMANRIVSLMEEEELLDRYLVRGKRRGCVPITRVSPEYPLILRKRLGEDAPGCLWALGDISLLNGPKISLVGSRDLNRENLAFAREAGRQAARQDYILVSGNARGADSAAQEQCLAAGGRVISVVADKLEQLQPGERVLYLSELDYDEAFSSQRALSRNRCIHALGSKVLVAQSTLRKGGTWDGTVKNLRFGWSPVFCYEDGSEAARMLIQMGANGIGMDDLGHFDGLTPAQSNFLDRQ